MGKVADASLNETDQADISVCDDKASYEEKLRFTSVIAKPMAPRKLTKRLLKMVKKGMKHKGQVGNGLKDVQTRLRKGEKGIVVLAGDVSPIDVMCHIPGVCENRNVPYVYVPSRRCIGAAMGRQRGCVMALVKKHADYEEIYDQCLTDIKQLPPPTAV